MTARLVNRRDLDFVLFELLDAGALCERTRYADHSRETFGAALDLATRLATEHFAPHNREADQNEPEFNGTQVRMIPAVKDALRRFSEAGLLAASHDYERGGMQLPFTIAQACFALFNAANVSTSGYALLTMAAAGLIDAHGSAEQRATWLEPMLQGRYFGTMALTEPQAGSSLSDLRTSAEPTPSGHHVLRGNKIFISGGDHELSENIVHLVLARIQGAPAGVKGISLFIVPKILPDGRRNDVTLAGLIHKMGYRGTTSAMLNFGERTGAIGWLVGEANQGLSYMFHMMNEARVGVGLGAVMLGYSGYLHALAYARERPQGRPAGARDMARPQVPIVQHSDVRRMLLAQKSYVEGGLALCLHAARLADDQHTFTDDAARREAALLLDILTPIVKSWPSQWCLEANSLAIQVHGGYGYTREYPVEQLYRDNRLNPIHEGTHGIQAIDLLGRKVVMQDGAAWQLLVREIRRTIGEAAVYGEALAGHAAALGAALDRAIGCTATLHATGDVELTLANASVYLDMLGTTVVAWIWLRQGLCAAHALPTAAPADVPFYRGKLQACAYFHGWELPRTVAQAALLRSLDRTCLDMRDEWF